MERTKMPRIKRAAQFAPFDALKGLHDALERKRKEHITRQKVVANSGDSNNEIKNEQNETN